MQLQDWQVQFTHCPSLQGSQLQVHSVFFIILNFYVIPIRLQKLKKDAISFMKFHKKIKIFLFYKIRSKIFVKIRIII